MAAIDMRINHTPCIYPKCEKGRRTRGLCSGHAATAHRLIRKGEAKESDLLVRGLMLPKHSKPGRVTSLPGVHFVIGSKVQGRARNDSINN